jgi:hypothetical protein
MTPRGFAFESKFAPGYHRVANKGRKNLRCFPHCRERGHVKSGFCGAPLKFALDGLPEKANGNVQRVLTWGEFASAVAPPRFNPGDVRSEDELENLERYVHACLLFKRIFGICICVSKLVTHELLPSCYFPAT